METGYYSEMPAALPPYRYRPNGKRKTAQLLSQSGCLIGAGTKSRTRDPLITSQVLYQLSYTGKEAELCR